MAGLLAQVATVSLLRSAWLDVLSNDSDDGVLGAGVSRFADDAEDNLGKLADRVLAGTYRPGRLTRLTVGGSGAKPRRLQVPTVSDRVVERAVLAVLTPIVDPWLGPASFAYRPGLGVVDAVQALARLRDEGLTWVARTDVDDCFPSIPVGHLRRMIVALVDDAGLIALINALLCRRSVGSGGEKTLPGLAQGSPLSPMWANLVLADVDVRLCEAGFPMVRYADDLAIAAASPDEAWEAMRVASDAVAELGMRLGPDKSAVMSFRDGFCFLGEDFGPRYPPALDDYRSIEPPRRVLYVAVQGSHVRVAAGRVVVESAQDQELLNAPSGQLERVVLFGAVGLSAGARSWALANAVDLVFLSRRGSYLGHGWAAASKTRVTRLRAQLAASGDAGRAVVFARAVVEAKIRKQIVLLQRFGRRDTAEAVADGARQMRQLLVLLPDAATREELMGVEGAAGRTYFAALQVLLPASLNFRGRTRRPPLDVVNAALSYAYAVLLGEAVSALGAAGLDPAVGMLHADDDTRPSLALDLIEEFRPLIVDQIVVAVARRGELRLEHGRREEGVPGVLLTRAGREIVIRGYERRMLQFTRGALPDFAGSLRRHLYRQGERVAAFVHARSGTWTGLSWR